MPGPDAPPSARKTELLEAAYAYVRLHGMNDLSLRPLASAIGSSPRVLLFLFGTKEGLLQALLARARQDELEVLSNLRHDYPDTDLPGVLTEVWGWLSDPDHRDLLVLWVEGYARSLVDPAGPWADFARQTVTDWLDLLADYQPPRFRRSAAGRAERTAALALLRGALLDLLATGDRARVTVALNAGIEREPPLERNLNSDLRAALARRLSGWNEPRVASTGSVSGSRTRHVFSNMVWGSDDPDTAPSQDAIGSGPQIASMVPSTRIRRSGSPPASSSSLAASPV